MRCVAQVPVTTCAEAAGTDGKPDMVALGVAFRDRLDSVDDEAQEHLCERALVAVDGGDGREVPDEPRPATDLILGHGDAGLEDLLELHRHCLRIVAAREGTELADDVPHALRAVARVVDGLEHVGARRGRLAGLRRLAGESLEEPGEVRGHVGERIVELVGDPRREGAHRHHPIGKGEAPLHRSLLGDVA